MILGSGSSKIERMANWIFQSKFVMNFLIRVLGIYSVLIYFNFFVMVTDPDFVFDDF